MIYYLHHIVKKHRKVGHSMLWEHPWEKPTMVDIIAASCTGEPWQSWNGNHGSAKRVHTVGYTHLILRLIHLQASDERALRYLSCLFNCSQCSPQRVRPPDCRLICELLSGSDTLADWRSHKSPRAGRTDAISHLIDFCEKNSLLERETLSLTQHWFWFTSIYFNHLLTGVTQGLDGGYPHLFFFFSSKFPELQWCMFLFCLERSW